MKKPVVLQTDAPRKVESRPTPVVALATDQRYVRLQPSGYADEEWLAAIEDARRLGYGFPVE